MIEAGPILLVDAGLSAHEPDAPQVALALAEAGYMVQSADVAGTVEAVRGSPPALVVLDADAPGAMALLATLRGMAFISCRTPRQARAGPLDVEPQVEGLGTLGTLDARLSSPAILDAP